MIKANCWVWMDLLDKPNEALWNVDEQLELAISIYSLVLKWLFFKIILYKMLQNSQKNQSQVQRGQGNIFK